ncbi:MAG: hemerythrin domain-containing protein [Rhodocyclales bacterium]|nr:hemerythrin domain-containing protein [Rhodocyclales bacterium]
MKRNPALQDLSREHHDALKLARDGKAAALSGDGALIAALAARTVREFEREMEAHFQEEEAGLLPFLKNAGESDLVWRTLADHAALRALAKALRQPDGETLRHFAEVLTSHVRFEERTLFEAAQRHGFAPTDEFSVVAAPTPAAAPPPAAPALHR